MSTKRKQLEIRKEIFSRVKRCVIKVGTGVLTRDRGIDEKIINRLAREMSWLMDEGYEVLLVSSGAIGSGVKKMGLREKPAHIPQKQAAAAVGQPSLMLAYEKAFGRHKRRVAQVLLTRDDLCNRKRHLNARNTLNILLEWEVLPIINENDTVVVDELKFGDNDNLSAMITHLMDAQVLISLTDTDGLYDKNPQTNQDAALMPLVSKIDRALEQAAGDIPGAFGMGGMSSKVQTAKKVTTSGIPMIIASGLKPGVLKSLFQGKDVGTLFLPRGRRMASRKCWIAFTLKEKGAIRVDRGAAKAICEQGKSLLPIGITRVDGDFGEGAMVCCLDPDGVPFARGLVNYGAAEIKRLMGLRTTQIREEMDQKHYDEVIHRDNLVMINDGSEECSCQ